MTVPPRTDYGRREAAQRWLLRAATDVPTALGQWGSGPAVLVAGRGWDAVRVPYEALDPAFDAGTDPTTLRTCLSRLRLIGPAFCDPRRANLYFLVQARTDRQWPHEELSPVDVVCFGGTGPYAHHIGVPRVDRTEPPGLFWLVPLDRVGYRHVDAAHLLGVVRARRQAVPELVPGTGR